MVEVKREDITLQDRTKGISADEFAGGSYHFAEGIQTGYSTKGFKLGNKLQTSVLNYRENGRAVAWTTIAPWGTVAFTEDCRIEGEDFWNGNTTASGGIN